MTQLFLRVPLLIFGRPLANLAMLIYITYATLDSIDSCFLNDFVPYLYLIVVIVDCRDTSLSYSHLENSGPVGFVITQRRKLGTG